MKFHGAVTKVLAAIAASGSEQFALQLQLRSDLTDYTLQAVLDGVTYTLWIKWNVRSASWLLAVLDEQGDTVLQGQVKVVVNFPIACYFTGRSPPGVFLAIDTGGTGAEAVLGDLGARVQLYYYASAAFAGV